MKRGTPPEYNEGVKTFSKVIGCWTQGGMVYSVGGNSPEKKRRRGMLMSEPDTGRNEQLKEKQEQDTIIAEAIDALFSRMVEGHVTDIVLSYRTSENMYYQFWAGEFLRCVGLSASLTDDITRGE